LIKFKYEGLLEHEDSLENEVNTYNWLTIYLDNHRNIILINISEFTSSGQEVDENFFYENGKIVVIKKALIESERSGWDHVSQNVYSNNYFFSRGGLMTYYRNDTEGFSTHHNQIEDTYILKETGTKEYFTAAYLYEIVKYIVQVAEHKTRTANKT
jgi:hypothetical protein